MKYWNILVLGLGVAGCVYGEEALEVQQLDKVVVTGTADSKTVFDLAQGASVLSDSELREQRKATLGETLAGLPGVTSTYYGPGASRPLIRGLGGDRIRVLDNGIGALDASNVSPDHNTSIEPLLVQSIEVLRGPATLLYGSSAVGGVVNVIENRIPLEAPAMSLSGKAEGRYESASQGTAGVVSIEAGDSHVAIQLNAARASAGDLRIPGVARVDADAPAVQPVGTLPSSAVASASGSLGVGTFGDWGRAGLSLSRYETDYGVPTGEEQPVSISMRQTRIDFEGALLRVPEFLKEIRVRAGFGTYHHSELSDGTIVNTTFRNRADEARLELVQAKAGRWSGTWGLQTSGSRFSTVGEEVVTPPYSSRNLAAFVLEQLEVSDTTHFEVGSRLETERITLGSVPPGLPDFANAGVRSGERFKHGGSSASLGIVERLTASTSLALSVSASSRLPTAQELFANGPHGGTGAYEVGTPALDNERSLGIELTLKKREGRVTGSTGVFANRFTDYIYERHLTPAEIPGGLDLEDLIPYRYTATDALFWGFEAEGVFHAWEGKTSSLHLHVSTDYVHAEDTRENTPLPRMPPWRGGAGATFTTGAWDFDADVKTVARQNRVSEFETETPGYTMIDVGVRYRGVVGKSEYEVFLRGLNLGNAEARVSTSFLKDFAPLAGRSATAGVRLTF